MGVTTRRSCGLRLSDCCHVSSPAGFSWSTIPTGLGVRYAAASTAPLPGWGCRCGTTASRASSRPSASGVRVGRARAGWVSARWPRRVPVRASRTSRLVAPTVLFSSSAPSLPPRALLWASLLLLRLLDRGPQARAGPRLCRGRRGRARAGARGRSRPAERGWARYPVFGRRHAVGVAAGRARRAPARAVRGVPRGGAARCRRSDARSESRGRDARRGPSLAGRGHQSGLARSAVVRRPRARLDAPLPRRGAHRGSRTRAPRGGDRRYLARSDLRRARGAGARLGPRSRVRRGARARAPLPLRSHGRSAHAAGPLDLARRGLGARRRTLRRGVSLRPRAPRPRRLSLLRGLERGARGTPLASQLGLLDRARVSRARARGPFVRRLHAPLERGPVGSLPPGRSPAATVAWCGGDLDRAPAGDRASLPGVAHRPGVARRAVRTGAVARLGRGGVGAGHG